GPVENRRVHSSSSAEPKRDRTGCAGIGSAEIDGAVRTTTTGAAGGAIAMSSSDTSRPVIDRAQSRALAIGVVCFVAAIIWGFILSKRPDEGGWTHFFQSYLFAFVFVVAIPLGSLGFLMLHHSTGGWW